jgi:hypothetical protein
MDTKLGKAAFSPSFRSSTANRRGIALLIAVNALLAVFVVFRETSARVSAPPAASASESPGLSARVASLESQAQTLRFAAATRLVSGSPATSPAESSEKREAPPRPTPSAHPAQALPSAQALDHLAETEPRDRTWAAREEQDIRDGFGRDFPEEEIRELRCATSVCRIVVQNSSPDRQREFEAKYWASLPPYAAVNHKADVDDHGNEITVLRLVRRGYEETVFGSQ